MSIEQYPFHTPELSRDVVPTQEALLQAAGVLADPFVQELAQAGALTVAMIRPAVREAVSLPFDSDRSAAEAIEERFMHLGVLAKFSLSFDDLAVHEFYGDGHAAPMTPFPALRYPERFPNRMEEFADLMISGPTTIYLLTGPEAIATWRAQLGHWDIEQQRDPATIRGQLGVSNYNNLLHGSDSEQSAARELGILHNLVLRKIADQ